MHFIHIFNIHYISITNRPFKIDNFMLFTSTNVVAIYFKTLVIILILYFCAQVIIAKFKKL